jgi:uncharacterized protein YggT (Ycf19 family)
MALIDFLLNLAGLLLWIAWRSQPFDPVAAARPATLPGTLRRAEPSRVRRWHFLAALLGLLVLRAVAYHWVGGALGQVQRINLGVLSLAFRCDLFWSRTLPGSFLSFADVWFTFFAWLLLFSLAPSGAGEPGPGQRFVRVQLGRVAQWPRGLRIALPFVGAGLAWLGLSPVLGWLGVMPSETDWGLRAQQAVVMGLGAYLLWQTAAVCVLLLHLVDSHVYLGAHPLWNFVGGVGRWLLRPLRWLPLRWGRMDFAPVVGIAILFGLGRLLESQAWGLPALYRRLPF